MGPKKLAVVGVMGAGAEAHEDLCGPLGSLIARLGCHLLTGGGAGVMAAVSKAFVEAPERAGLCLGVLKGSVTGGRHLPIGPNPYVEVAIHTHLPDSGTRGQEPTSRNHLNVLSSTAVVCLPGGFGTESELELARSYGRPVAVHARPGDRIGSRTAPELAEAGVPVFESIEPLEAWLRERVGAE